MHNAKILTVILCHVSLLVIGLIWSTSEPRKVILNTPTEYFVNIIEHSAGSELAISSGLATTSASLALEDFHNTISTVYDELASGCPPDGACVDSVEVILYSSSPDNPPQDQIQIIKKETVYPN